jgi:hypothetical protein
VKQKKIRAKVLERSPCAIVESKFDSRLYRLILAMAFCYRFKWRIPHPKEGCKVITFKLVVPFKSRKASNGRFGYRDQCYETWFRPKSFWETFFL